MATILYVQHIRLPDEVRAEKICRSLVRAGHRVTALTRWSPGLAEREEYQGYTVIRAGFERPSAYFTALPFNPLWRNAIRRIATEFRPDCIIVREMLIADGTAAVARKFDVPLLVDMAENYPAAMRGWKKYQGSFAGRLATKTLRIPDAVEKMCVTSADGIIVVCQEQVDRLNKQYGLPSEQIVVVHNTPDYSDYAGMTNNFSGEIVFGHHGYCTAQRNLDVFLRGFALASKAHDGIRVEIHGGGESLPEVKRVAQDEKIEDICVFSAGEYKLYDLPKLIERSAIGIVPYIPDEFINNTISNKVFDYMAAGRPLFASKATTLARIIEETKAGISWDCTTPESVAEGIKHLLKSDLQTMSENGKHWAREKYNWEADESVLCEFVERYCP